MTADAVFSLFFSLSLPCQLQNVVGSKKCVRVSHKINKIQTEKMCRVVRILAILIIITKISTCEYLPILIWHGLLADPKTDSLFIKDWIRNETSEGIYIKSIDLTINELHEQAASVFVHPLKQIDQVCLDIAQDEKLKRGFNAIGMSQGGQFM